MNLYHVLGFSEELLEEERNRVKKEYEAEMIDLKSKMESEKNSKAKMAAELEAMKKEHEAKLKEISERAERARTAASRQHSFSEESRNGDHHSPRHNQGGHHQRGPSHHTKCFFLYFLLIFTHESV